MDVFQELSAQKYSRHKEHALRPNYSLVQPAERLPLGWNAKEAVNVAGSLPRAHKNFEKETLNEIDRKSTQNFL